MKSALVRSLDVLFLRHEKAGEIITQGGDIDNRIKTLFDALQVPKNCNGIEDTPESNGNLIFCLLEDDALITDVSVTTDRLLTTKKEGNRQHDVSLVIHVKVKASESMLYGNLRFVP